MGLHNRARTNPFQRHRIAENVASGEWTVRFVAVDDHARLARVELFRAETAESAVRFLDGVIGSFDVTEYGFERF